ncbi:uncharacterized protein F5147DRAFT_837306 [Suillus discolor]|uniref:Uncharacterized protein n=1 Tax=Suillus discolor TaxID=1912936 RepID=A0A9P7F5B6_9AGAM|nr:uncharacterized protein F5147DRAFT_837306 [Suillus discolor]KAG2107723.1 hypothetical protein F5147DRAFT_837306 [Suillus discolor]
MTQSTPPASSPHGSDSSDATHHMPNTDMHMGQLPGPEPACIPHPGYATYHPGYVTYHPYGVPPHWTCGPAPPYAPVVPSPGAGAGVARHAFQAGQNGYYPPGGANPHAYAPPIPHQGILNQHHGPGLSVGSTSLSLPQAPGCQKQVRQRRKVKKSELRSSGIENDPLFKPVLDEYGQPKGKFVCAMDGRIIGPSGYLVRIPTLMIDVSHHHVVVISYTRGDSYKRHLDNGTCERSTAVGALPSYPATTSSASPAPVAAPTMAFAYAYPCPYPRFSPSMSQNVQSGTPGFTNPVLFSRLEEEEDEEEDDSDFWEANEI